MQIESRSTAIETPNLRVIGGKKLRTTVETIDLIPDAQAFLDYVVRYLEETGARIRHHETFAYGYWLTRFTELDEYCEIDEYSIDGAAVVPGVTRAVTYWRIQNQLCARYSAPFMPPTGSSLVVISNDIMAGSSPIQGVRYPSPPHMSGWWLTDDAFDGDIGSLIKTHAYHLAAARPEVVPLLALPHGYRFDLRHHEDVWFDEAVASEPA